MRTAAVAFIVSMLTGTILTPLVRSLAHRMGALDHALSSRKIHGRPIPRIGGVAIVLAFYAPLVGLVLFHTGVGEMFFAERDHVVGLFLGGLSIALLGLYDDFRGAGAGRKFAVQFAVAGLMYWFGFRIEVLANPLGEPIALGWVGLPFTLLWFVGVMNAVNLIDGLDGLAGGVAFLAVLTSFLVSVQRGHPLMTLFSSALAGAILGFLFYNFNPASIFMGDTGSMFLGFVLAASATQTHQKSSTAVAMLIPAIALGLPIMDTLLAVGRRAIRGQPLFRADKEHIHHRLIAVGLTHRQAVLVLYGFCVLLAGVALVLTYANSTQAAFLLLGLGAFTFVALRALGYLRLDRMSASAEDRRRNRALRAAVRPLGRKLREARTLPEVWAVVERAAALFGACGITVEMGAASAGLPAAAGVPTSFRHGLTEESQETDAGGGGGAAFRLHFPVPGVKASDGGLELYWSDGRREIDRDTEIAIDMLCEYLSDAFENLRSPPVPGRFAGGTGPQAKA